MAFQSLERLVGDMVLDLARIGSGDVGIYSEGDEKVGEESVTVEHLDRYLASNVG